MSDVTWNFFFSTSASWLIIKNRKDLRTSSDLMMTSLIDGVADDMSFCYISTKRIKKRIYFGLLQSFHLWGFRRRFGEESFNERVNSFISLFFVATSDSVFQFVTTLIFNLIIVRWGALQLRIIRFQGEKRAHLISGVIAPCRLSANEKPPLTNY